MVSNEAEDEAQTNSKDADVSDVGEQNVMPLCLRTLGQCHSIEWMEIPLYIYFEAFIIHSTMSIISQYQKRLLISTGDV
jgi:hypothetical protein